MTKNILRFFIIVLIATGSAIGGAYIFKQIDSNNSGTSISASQPVRLVNYSAPPEAGVSFVQAAEMTVNAVVHVKTTSTSTSSGSRTYDPFRDFFGDRNFRQPRMQESSGSGVILSEDGYIITNNHVVQNADKVQITLNDNRTFEASVVGTDPSTDLALLRIKQKGLPFIYYGNSDDVKVGEWVLAVGNPFNLTSTVTAGIVSAKARNIGILPDQYALESFIQTDAAVNPGNSGGALVNTKGELVGINSAIASTTGAFSGYSFAIPVNIVKKVVDDLVEFGTVQRAFIGVSIRGIDSKLATDAHLKDLKGVFVSGTTEGGAAAAAGIQEGDVITSINGVTVNSTPQLQEQVGKFRPGDKITVSLVRDGKPKDLTLVLRNKEGNTEIIKNDYRDVLGANFETVSIEESNKLGIENGVKIKQLGKGKLAEAGIKEGFIITSIDKSKVTSTDDVTRILQNKKGGILIEGIYPNGMRAYYGFGI